MFNENDEVKKKRNRKRKSLGNNPAGTRTRWNTADFRAMVRQHNHEMSREPFQSNQPEDDFYDWWDTLDDIKYSNSMH